MKKNTIIILAIAGILGIILCGLSLIVCMALDFHGSAEAFSVWGVCLVVSLILSLAPLASTL